MMVEDEAAAEPAAAPEPASEPSTPSSSPSSSSSSSSSETGGKAYPTVTKWNQEYQEVKQTLSEVQNGNQD